MGQDAASPGSTPPPPAGGNSGHYEFDKAGFDNIITQVTACLEKVRTLRGQAGPMTTVQPMGDEPSSKKVAQRVNESGKAYLTHNQELENYYKKLKDDLTKARDTYVAQEQHASHSFNTVQRNQ